ncbi:hypothetical protein [Candidatus Methylomicrobium oryzae]|uniref:hypothetical protein n=1 Tax=Candidatus Methylomicrobium oryzae TaxID=2802053 RepID=UPI001921C059|nr:hypothetical protein [Methylomicrobium sp. RS1]MBL1264283.1 hypothetical protein [Methylomicrobium sp. RS1]
MKIQYLCPQCHPEPRKSSIVTLRDLFEVEQKQISDNGIHPAKCDKGHEFVIIFEAAKFETLFDIGMNALRDGYPREAVSSFTASFERFLEFYIRYVWHLKKIEPSIIEKTWKLMENQSERQLGAFISLYTVEQKESPPCLSNEKSKFRNKVIHKGYIPSINEAINFGKTVYEIILEIVIKLENWPNNSLLDFYFSQTPKYPEEYKFVINHSPQAICLARKFENSYKVEFNKVLKYFDINYSS